MTAFVSRAHDVVALRLHGPVRWALRAGTDRWTPTAAGRHRRAPARRPDHADRHGSRTRHRAGSAATRSCAGCSGPISSCCARSSGEGPTLDDVPPNWTELLRAHAALHRDLYHRVHLDLGPVTGSGRPRTCSPPHAGPGHGAAAVRRRPVRGDQRDRRAAARRCRACGAAPTSRRGRAGTRSTATCRPPSPRCSPPACPELMLPLFDLRRPGAATTSRRNARRLYGAARHLLAPVHLSTHGRQNHFGPVWCQTFWTAGAGLAGPAVLRLLALHRRPGVPGDPGAAVHARGGRVLPRLRAVRDGGRAFAPSYSPENAPANTGSQACVNATMDVAVVRDLLRNLLAATASSGVDDPAEPALARRCWPRCRRTGSAPAASWPSGLRPGWPTTTRTGTPRTSIRCGTSRIRPSLDDPALRAAAAARRPAAAGVLARATGPARWPSGWPSSGWPPPRWAWPTRRAETLALMAARYWRPNLVPTHNRGAHLQRRHRGGLPAVVAAMLVAHARGTAALDLLPALPAAWPTGAVRGSGRARRGHGAAAVLGGRPVRGRSSSRRIDQDLLVSVAGGEPELLSVMAGRSGAARRSTGADASFGLTGCR